MNAGRIPRGAIAETRNGSSEPRRRWWTRILHKGRALRMLKGSLGFTVVVETELINRTVIDRPGMADIPLLIEFVRGGGKTGYVSPSSLKLGKRGDQLVMVEIVIDAEILLVVNSLIKLYRELVCVIGLHRDRHQGVADRRGLEQIEAGPLLLGPCRLRE